MRRWLEVTTGYMAACQARGMGAERRKATCRELERLGSWLLSIRSTLTLEEIDTELLVNYIRGRSVCRAAMERHPLNDQLNQQGGAA